MTRKSLAGWNSTGAVLVNREAHRERHHFFLSHLSHFRTTPPLVRCRLCMPWSKYIIFIDTHTLNSRGVLSDFCNTSSSPKGNLGPRPGTASAPCPEGPAEPLCKQPGWECPVPAQGEPSCVSQPKWMT